LTLPARLEEILPIIWSFLASLKTYGIASLTKNEAFLTTSSYFSARSLSNCTLNLSSTLAFCSALNYPLNGSFDGLAAEISFLNFFSISAVILSDKLSLIR
jgi:hypothetical protein